MDYASACELLAPHRDEIAATLPALEAAAAPCGAKAVVATLAPLASLYGISDRSEAEWKTFYGFYTAALSDVPLEALKAGVQDYIKRADSEFFPKPGPLLELCNARAEKVRRALGRARAVTRQAA